MIHVDRARHSQWVLFQWGLLAASFGAVRLQYYLVASAFLIAFISCITIFHVLEQLQIVRVSHDAHPLSKTMLFPEPSTRLRSHASETDDDGDDERLPHSVTKRKESRDKIQIVAQEPSSETSPILPMHEPAYTEQILVVHKGTVMEFTDADQKTGLILPDDVNEPVGMSWQNTFLIPFSLDQHAGKQVQLKKGMEVKYSTVPTPYGESEGGSPIRAVNVTPTEHSLAIAKLTSRDTLRMFQQEHQQSFAKAMCTLTSITPRNEPVAHQVDLIKYAKELDGQELAMPY